jgi:hypothetical protein
MNTRSHLRRSLLIPARAMWIVFAICNLISLPFGIQWSYAQTLATWRSEPIVAQALTQIHLTASQEAASFTVIYVLASLVFLMIGFLIIWRLWGTSNELLGLLTSFIFITIGGTGITGIFTGFSGPPNPVLQIIFFVSGSSFSLLFPCLAVFLMIFPNGRFAPRWSWILIILWIIQGIPFLEFFSQNIFLPLLPVVVLLVSGNTLGVQIYRYVRIYTYSERQQTKWLIFGVTTGLLLFVGLSIIGDFIPELSRPDSLYQLLVNNLGGLLVFLPIAVSVSIALLRYRLWNIDIIINRTLVYGTLTVILSVIYIGLIFGLQALLHGVISQENGVAIVISTLATAALFQPLRHRLQMIVDRRFYRSKYDAAKIIETFSATLRNEVDLEQLSEQLVAVVQETMQPTHISLWMSKPGRNENHPFQTSDAHS